MKFNRKLLEEETLQKIKEVNDEAGYRSYLEVPEMVNIIASIMEEMLTKDEDATLKQCEENWKRVFKTKNDLLQQWEACADRLFVYAMETLSTATNMALYEVAKEDVLEYNRLKNGNE